MIVKVRAPGSCGELVQGMIDGKNFLITCPVELHTEVVVKIGEKSIAAGGKTIEAVEKTWAHLGVAFDSFSVSVQSDLPKGKGMASSSADISAACQAAAICAGTQLSLDEISDIALSIEPTDGIFYPGIVMFDHVHGLIRKPLGSPPPLTVAIFDVGGEIDTLQFNLRSDLNFLNQNKEPLVREAVTLVSRGIAAQDAVLIGRGATMSALANQDILFKPCLTTIIGLIAKFGAVGVSVAHSGTVIGIIFPDSAAVRIDKCIEAVRQACPELTFLRTARLIAGGLTIVGGIGDE